MNWSMIQVFLKSNPAIDFFDLSNVALSIFTPTEQMRFYAIQHWFSIIRVLFWPIFDAHDTTIHLKFLKVSINCQYCCLSHPEKLTWTDFQPKKRLFIGIYLGIRIFIILFISSHCPTAKKKPWCVFLSSTLNKPLKMAFSWSLHI